MSFIQTDSNTSGNSQDRNNNNNNSGGAQAQGQPVVKEGMPMEQEDQQDPEPVSEQVLGRDAKDGVTSELTTAIQQDCPSFLPLSVSDSAAAATSIEPMTTIPIIVSIDAATEAAVEAMATASLESQRCTFGSDIDVSTASTTIMKTKTIKSTTAAVDKTRAAASFLSTGMTADAIDNNDTAPSRPSKDEKGIPAQPSTPSSFSLLCRTRRNSEENKNELRFIQQQPAPNITSALPSCTSPSPSTSSSSSTFVEGFLDEVLLTALQNRQDRQFLLKLERDYCNFIGDPSKEVLEYPWLNSYFRMMIHRSAIYYQLARTVDSAHKKIMLSKTEHSAIPSLRFRELVEEEEDTPIKSFKVLRRCPTRPVSACEARGSGCANTSDDLSEAASSAPAQSSPWSSSGGQSNNGRRSGVTLEQREVEYAKARARIFDSGDDVEGANDGGDDQEHEDMYRRTSDFVVSSGELAVGKKEESRRSVSGVSTAKSSSSVDSHSRLDVGQGNGQKQSKPKSDLTRRTSTSSTVSSSSTSSGTTMGDTSARSDFVGSWIAGHHHPHHHHQGSSSGVQPSSGVNVAMSDHRSSNGGSRTNFPYCECGVDHGLPGPDVSRRICGCHLQPHEAYHHPSVGCVYQNNYASPSSSHGSQRHPPSSVHGGYHGTSTARSRQQQQHQHQQQQRLYAPCQQHYPQHYQQHPYQHPSNPLQHQHQHHAGYQHPVSGLYGHPVGCQRHDPQQQQHHRQPYYNQHQHHYQPHLHQHHQHHLTQQQQQQQQPHSQCFYSHHHHPSQQQHPNRTNGGSFQDPRWLDCIARPEMPASSPHFASSPAVTMETTPHLQDASPPHPPGPFQVSVRPYPSSNGYRPYRQGISLPQQLTRQTQQRQHLHPPGQTQGQTQSQTQGQNQQVQSGQRQQQRQQGVSNTRQQQQRSGQQQQQPQQHHQHQPKLSLGSVDHLPHSHSPTPSSTSTSSSSSGASTTRSSQGGKEDRGPSTHARHHHTNNGHNQRQQHNNITTGSGTLKGRENSAPIIVHDVERRPPKSTELYDPYASTTATATGSGSGSKSRHSRH